jgi:hypothetical protein
MISQKGWGAGHGLRPGARLRGAMKTVDSCPRIDVRQWHRKGFLVLGMTFSWPVGIQGHEKLLVVVEEEQAVLRFHDDELGPLTEQIPLERTLCHYGGDRSWFRCPGVRSGQRCGRRVAILYKVGWYFLCRRCHGLVYKSQRQDRLRRLEAKARKIRRRLGGSEDLTAPFPPRPQRMHCQTYERLRTAAEEIQLALLRETTGKLQRQYESMVKLR